MKHKVKTVKTDLPLGITIEFDNGIVKGMSLSDLLEQMPILTKLKDNPSVFLKPSTNKERDTIEWWSNGDVIILDASVVFDKGQALLEHEARRHLRYVDMFDEFQCGVIPTCENYIFNTPFTIRVANYINLPESADVSPAKKKYKQLLQRHPHIIDVGTYRDIISLQDPYSLDSPQLVKLLTDCSNGKIDVIYTDSIFSFANTLTASIDIAQQLFDIGIMVYFNREDFLSDSFAFDTFQSIYQELMLERSLPQICLGSEAVVRVLNPGKKNPFGEAEKYMALPYVTSITMDAFGIYTAEYCEFPICKAQGKTREEAIANLKKQQRDCIYQMLNDGEEVPPAIEWTMKK